MKKIPTSTLMSSYTHVHTHTHTHTHTQFHMGNCAEDTAKKHDISRSQQDEYAQQSYLNSAHATESGILAKEMVSVAIPQKKGKPDVVVKIDEEFSRCYDYQIWFLRITH